MTLIELLDNLERESRPTIKEQMLRELTDPELVMEVQEYFRLALSKDVQFGCTWDERRLRA